MTYVLESDEKTKESYPYDFILSITYRLEKNRIHVVWQVHNTGDKEMHFQIGGHPAFNVPGMEEGGPLKGAMIFDNKGLVERIYGNVGGCVNPERFDTGSRNGLWLFTEETFRDDAVIIDKCQLRQVCLIDKDQNPVVTVDFKAPAVGIWSPYGKQATFVCIEPWYGLHDWVGYDGEFKDKYITFSADPRVIDISKCTTLHDALIRSYKEDDISNTNLKKVFRLILDTARMNKYKNEDLPKNILVISDMQFDAGYMAMPLMSEIELEYRQYGYDLPKLIFWNVAGSVNRTIPVTVNKNGVILISGYTQSLLKMVMSNETDPYKALVAILATERYKAVADALDLV